jgi:hypothetical protein
MQLLCVARGTTELEPATLTFAVRLVDLEAVGTSPDDLSRCSVLH